MPDVIEPHHVVQHLAQNGSEFFTLSESVTARYGDLIHYNGRKYVVERVERIRTDGSAIVRAAYKGKL